MTQLKLYNSLTREKEVFGPLDPAHVRIYVCGPTVYNYAHIGNARPAVVFDVLAGLLRRIYPKVTYASNITDVDDKIMAAAKDTGESVDAISRKYETIYNQDMASLGVRAPDVQPRATEHIGQMIALIQKLVKNGYAYESKGHVLFHVPAFHGYGGLSGRSRDEQIAGARVDVAPYKKDPADFVLWKPSTPDQPGWDSPYGRGRPGWHIECSAMAEAHLGVPFDLHGGGADLKFPHHENEIAQSCCAHGTEDLAAFAKMWVHNGFVTVEGEKMSKSLGNVLLVHDLLGSYKGEVLRMALLSAHYRQPLDWTENGLKQAQATLEKMYQHLYALRDVETPENVREGGEVFEALCDDLNTPKALAALNALSSEAGKARTSELKGALLAVGGLLGLLQADPAEWLGYGGASDDADSAKIESLVAAREVARKSKDYKRADEIRGELSAMGITLEDTPKGVLWRRG